MVVPSSSRGGGAGPSRAQAPGRRGGNADARDVRPHAPTCAMARAVPVEGTRVEGVAQTLLVARAGGSGPAAERLALLQDEVAIGRLDTGSGHRWPNLYNFMVLY